MPTLRVYPGKRGPVAQSQVEGNVSLQALSLTWAWGATPSPAAVTFAAPDTFPRIDVGAWLALEAYGRNFYGVAMTGTSKDVNGFVLPTDKSPGGRTVRIDFVDPRFYLQFDWVWGAFNLEYVRIVNGIRLKRYRHLLPHNFDLGLWTFTNAPLTVEQILNYVFTSPEAVTEWSRIYHPDQVTYPVYNLDWTSGKRFDQALAELSEEQGLVFTVMDLPFQLVWARKGFDDFGAQTVTVPPKAKQVGVSDKISDAPTRVWVTGDRNQYLVLDLTLVPDWNRHYEALVRGGGLDGLTQDLYANDAAYNNISGDTEHAQGWLLASAKAKEMTVREYASLRLARDGIDFSDPRLYQTRSRMDMPVGLYLSELVLRAYRPPSFVPLGTIAVELRSLKIVNELFARVTHDPNTGIMNASVVTDARGNLVINQPGMGNGYVIVQGVSVDPTQIVELFATDRFVPSTWQDATNLWRPISFQIDESGEEEGPFIILDEQTWKSGDVFTMVDGHGVVNAKFTINPPSIKAALCFDADRFRRPIGVEGGRDAVLSIPSLRREVVVAGSAVLGEVVYGDGKTAAEKASEQAAPLLGMPFVNLNGGYQLPLTDTDIIPKLTGMLSRVSLEYASGGKMLTVEFASERGRRAYTPDKDLDRATRMEGAFHGQRELRVLAAMDRFQAAEARRNGNVIARQVDVLLRGRGGVEGRNRPVTVASPSGTLPAGTPLWRPPLRAQSGGSGGAGPLAAGSVGLVNTQAVMPTAVTDDHSILAGVTVRQDEDATGLVKVCEHGPARVRVKGPASVGDALGRVNGQDYLGSVEEEVADGDGVGICEQDVNDGEVKLVGVRLGAGSGGNKGTAVAVWG